MSHKTEDKLPPHSRFVPRQKPRRHGSKWLLGSAPSSLQKRGKADESDMPSCLRELPLRLLCHDALELERRAEIHSIDLNLFPQRFSSHWEERKLKHCLFINLLAFCFPKTRHRYLSSPVNQFLGSTVFLKKKFQVLSKEQKCMPQNEVLSAGNGLHWIKLLTKEDPWKPENSSGHCQGHWFTFHKLLIRSYCWIQHIHNSLDMEKSSCCLPRPSLLHSS